MEQQEQKLSAIDKLRINVQWAADTQLSEILQEPDPVAAMRANGMPVSADLLDALLVAAK